ncbi:hypothetical protein B0J18DRAFT_294322 [Chaetomium sp. MPI-SDFR-AT-0129]|nr:hypothetical protein B0J18DRAFT_294322 [Chaetomium sp. MPI-SDFR-AT-0129]
MSEILGGQDHVMIGKRNVDRSTTQSPSRRQETTIASTPSPPDCESHDTHPLMVTNLPLDILRMIFDHFEAHDIHQAEGLYGGLHRECEEDIHLRTQTGRQNTIRHLRLVCRAFYNVATPMMFSVLRIRPTPSGVRLLQHIAQCPSIAVGVRQLQIYLPYRPTIEARTLEDYVKVRIRQADSFAGESWPSVCDYSDSDNQSLDEEDALQMWLDIIDEWEEMATYESAPPPDVVLTCHQRLIVKGFAEVDLLRQQEQELLVDGGFVDVLIAAARHMPNIRLLRFQTSSRLRWLDVTTEAGIQWSRQVQRMSKTLEKHGVPGEGYKLILMSDAMHSAPNHHDTAQQVLLYTKLLWTVPIALYRADVRLEHLHVELDGWELNLSTVCEPHALQERADLPNREPVWRRSRDGTRSVRLART